MFKISRWIAYIRFKAFKWCWDFKDKWNIDREAMIENYEQAQMSLEEDDQGDQGNFEAHVQTESMNKIKIQLDFWK